MSRLLILYLGLLFWHCQVNAQQRSCFAHEQLDQIRSNRTTTWQQNAQAIRSWIDQNAGTLQQRSTIIIPVVFHIVYREDQDNLSDLQIRTQLDILNRDFNGLCENRDAIPLLFSDLEASIGIRFCLAAEDPDGNVSTGITRRRTILDDIGTLFVSEGRRAVHYEVFGGADGWDPEHYLNIWVADISGLLGSATFPGMAPFPEEDGILISPQATGVLGSAGQNSPFNRGHTLTHEMGHYLNLLHIWGNLTGCEEDDLVTDTPDQAEPYGSCPSFPQSSCGSTDMFMNFMDFTVDRCITMFTEGQKTRMMATLNTLRPGLLNSEIPCTSDGIEPTPLSSTRVFYSSPDRKLIITDTEQISSPVQITISTIDGKQIAQYLWQSGQTYVVDILSAPPAMFIVTLDDGQKMISHKIPVIRY